MQNYKKNFVKQTLAWVLAAVMVITMLPVGVFAEEDGLGFSPKIDQTAVRAVEAPDWDVSEEELETDYWPLTPDNRLVEVADGEAIRNPSIEYGGSYNLTDENSKIREVVTINFRTSAGPSVPWRRLLLKFDSELAQMIDWNRMQTGAWIQPQTNQSATTTINFNNGIKRFTAEPVDNVGSKYVYSVSLDDVKYKVPAIEAPMHFVLKDLDTLKAEKLPTSIAELTKDREPIVQARIVDKRYKRVYTMPSKRLNSYSTYTFSTIIPNKRYTAGLIPQSQTDNHFAWINAQNAFISYNKHAASPYVDLTIRHTKPGIETAGYIKNYVGLRTVLEDRFFNTLAGSPYKKADGTPVLEDTTERIADVFIISASEDPYGWKASYENPPAERRIPVLRSEINNGVDGLKFIQVVGTEYNQTAEEQNLKIKSSGKTYDTVVNGATSQTNKGVGTVVRFYVIPEKFEKLVAEADLLNMSFYTTFTSQTKTPKDTFTGKVDKDRDYKKGDILVLDPVGNTSFSSKNKMVLEVGERPHSMVFQYYSGGASKTPLQIQKGEEALTWEIPYNMTLKKDTPITLYADGIDTNITGFRFYTNETQQGLGDTGDFFTIDRGQKTGDMQAVRFAGSLKAPNISKTQNEVSVPEIFTTDEQIYGHTQLGEAIVRVKGASKDGSKVLNQAYLSDENDTYKDVGSGDNKDSVIDQKRSQMVIVNKKIHPGYEVSTKSAINPKDPLGDNSTVTNKKYNLIKDAPLGFTIEDYSINAVEKLPAVIEQVQAKVNFDLNGGYLGDNANDDNAKKPIVKIAPLNENYRYLVDNETNFPTITVNPDYKANAFEGANRRMVQPLKAITENGKVKYVPDTEADPVMASHTDQPLGEETYETAFNRYRSELKARLKYEQDNVDGNIPAVQTANIKEIQQDQASFEKYVDRFYKDKGIDITKSQLWLREFPGKESQEDLRTENPKKENLEFYGWTTKKITDGKVEEYNKLKELTTQEQAEEVATIQGQLADLYAQAKRDRLAAADLREQAESLGPVQKKKLIAAAETLEAQAQATEAKAANLEKADKTENFKFTENSPILSEMKVYAFYGPLKSEVTNPTQTYDEVKDKQYIEIAAEDGSIPTDATYKLVTKNNDGTYTEVTGLTPTTKEDGTPVLDITDLPSDKFNPNEDYYIETTELGKEPSYSTAPIKIDKVAPIESTNDEEKITATPDLFNYMVKITGKAKDDDHKIIKATVEANGNTVEVEATTNDDEFSIELQDDTLKQLGEAVSYKVTIYDEMGNKLEKTLTVEKVDQDLRLEIGDLLADDSEILLKSKKDAALTIRVIRRNKDTGKNQPINLDAAKATSDEFETIKLKQDGVEFKLEAGDRIIVDAKLAGYKDARIMRLVK